MAWEHAFSQHIFDLVLSEEDVEELRSEKNIKHTQVTSEELEELTVDESLSPYDRLVYILRDGKDVQKLHAITHMHAVLDGESKANIEKVLLLFNDVITSQSKDIQIACAKFMLHASQQRLVHGEKFAALFSKELLKSVKSKDPEIADEWTNALVGSFSIIPKRYIAEIVTFLKSSGSLTQPINIRLLCCKLIAHVSKYVDKHRLQNDLIPVMKSLCQDIDLDVRACMCSQLDVVVPSLGDQVIRDFLLPELSLLLQDEETTVRLVGLETLSKILQTVNPALIKASNANQLIPKFYSKALENEIILELIGCAHYIGQILCSEGVLDEEEKGELIQSYKCLCETETAKTESVQVEGSSNIDDSAKCRYWCAYNFPAVLISATEEQTRTILVPLFRSLIIDTHPTVRKPLACSFHEVANRLTKDVVIVYQCLNTFLVDNDIEVLDGVINGLPSTLGLLYCSTSVENFVSLILPTLLECEKFLSTSLRWRVHMKFLQNLEFLTEYVPSDDIQMKLVPLLFTVLNSNKVQPVKLAAGITLLSFLHHNRNVDERNEMCEAFQTELARSPSKASRILYLDLCHHIDELFSKNFFKENFYNAAMELASDTVVNVRLKFCETLPLLKSQIRLPCDRLMLQTLEQTVRRIMAMENDRDVANSIRQAITDMDCIRLSMDGTPPTEEDLVDREKEDEEEALVEQYNQRKSELEKLSPRGVNDRTRSNSCFESRESKGSFSSTEKIYAIKGVHKPTRSNQKIHPTKKGGAKAGQSSKVPASSSSGKINKRCSLPVVKDKRQ